MSIKSNDLAAYEDARRFEHFSIHNAVQAQLACPESSCQAYADIFTYNRWRAQGFQVMKGERGTRVTTWIPITRTDKAGNKMIVGRRPKTAILFCRHQVQDVQNTSA